MSAPNFSYVRRCVLVPAGDYDYEFGSNCPALGDCFDNDRSYPSRYLADYKDDFATVAIVLTSGYYADACIDIVDREDKTNELIGYGNYYSNYNRQELINDICYYLGCSPNFANTRLKGCRLGSNTYERDLEYAFDQIVEDWRDVELRKANKVVNKIMKDYGFKELTKVAQFSNGEAWYDYVK